MDQDNLDPADPIEPQDVPVESQPDQGNLDSWCDDAVPAEPGSNKKRINSRDQLILAGAVPILSLMREGFAPTIADVVDRLPDLLAAYPTRSGLSKSIGDSCGHNHGGLRLHRNAGAIVRCQDNVKLIIQRLPVAERERVANEAGFDSLSSLVGWANSLPRAR